MIRVARFLHGFVRHTSTRIVQEEIQIVVGDGRVPATLLRPQSQKPLPGWLVLHGITVPGRHHPMLLRFATALAASGGVVLIPEVDAWTRLSIDPAAANTILEAATRELMAREDVLPGGVSLVGFSFGATRAVIAAAEDSEKGRIRGVVAFGGYCDLRRTLVFMMTGEHDWQGTHYRLDPDPYGRWIVAANYLALTPGYEDTAPVKAALVELASEAGRRGVYAADPVYDPLKAELRQRLSSSEREIWDLLAPPASVRPDPAAARTLAEELVVTALQHHPALDPHPFLPDLKRPMVLAHGYADHLIPFTETLRFRSLIADHTRAHTAITRLFAHSTEAERVPFRRYPREMARYIQLLNQALRL